MKDNEMKKFYYLSVLLQKGKLLENFFGSTINLWGGCGLDDGGGREVGGAMMVGCLMMVVVVVTVAKSREWVAGRWVGKEKNGKKGKNDGAILSFQLKDYFVILSPSFDSNDLSQIVLT